MSKRVVAGVTIAACLLAIGAQPGRAVGLDDDQHCGLFSKGRETLTNNIGKSVDRVTRFSGVEVSCDKKAIVFRQAVSLDRGQLVSDWVERHGRKWSKTYCRGPAAFADAIRRGWTISTIITLRDGSEVRIDATCFDAEA